MQIYAHILCMKICGDACTFSIIYLKALVKLCYVDISVLPVFNTRNDLHSLSYVSFQYHPDKLDESLTQEDRDKAYEKFLDVDRAWKLLTDQDKKAKCDRQLKGDS